MVPVPPHVCYRYALRHDDPHQLVRVSLEVNENDPNSSSRVLTLLFHCSPNSSLETFQSSNAAVWVKIVSSWLCGIIYLWTMVAPALLPDRDFS